MKKIYILLALGIILLIGVMTWFVFNKEEFVEEDFGNYYCESSDDCVVINMDCSMCSCDVKAVSRDYAEYHRDLCIKYSNKNEHCDMDCLAPELDCIHNKCVILG